ncbi:MAG: hypothetical protein IIY78_10495 [Clostridia bacterium]|nr:hypothetical protein [Clostridia bacterium]
MDSQMIIRGINGFLHITAQYLVNWLNGILPRITADWWDECVMPNLSYTQHETALSKGFTKLSDFDLAALLRITNRSWYDMRTVAYLPAKEREVVREMMTVRNNWAHCSTELPGKDTILKDLRTISTFIGQINGEQSVCNEIDKFISCVEKPDSISQTPYPTGMKISGRDALSTETAPEEIRKNSMVYLVSTPETKGIVVSVKDLGSVTQYEVFVNNSPQIFFTGQIAPVKEAVGYNWISADEARSSLTAYQINNPSSQNLYSLNSARIDFVPYQFRPALKMIHADEPRILIADSVGVGKTIEAGLIIRLKQGL